MSTLFRRKYKNGKSVWVLQWKDRKTGRKKTKTLGQVSKTTAKKIQAVLDSELDTAKFSHFFRESRISLIDYSVEFLKHYSKRVEFQTHKISRIAFERLIHYIGNPFIGDIELKDIQRWQGLRNTEVSPHTTNKDHRSLKHAFNVAIKWHYIGENPFNELVKMKVPKKIPRVIPIEEIRLLFNIITDRKDRAFYSALYYLGSRTEELYSLKWSQIDFDLNAVTFSNETTKTQTDRRVWIHPSLQSLLLELPRDGDRPFNQFNRSDSVTKNFRKYTKLAGLSQSYTPKWLRHTLATETAPIDIKGTQEVLGHSDLKTTQNYLHYDLNKQKNILEGLPSPFIKN